jgi:ribosome-associated protein
VTASPRSIELALAAAQAAADKQARDIVVLDVSGQLVITDVFVIVSAANERAVRAVVDASRSDCTSWTRRRSGARVSPNSAGCCSTSATA